MSRVEIGEIIEEYRRGYYSDYVVPLMVASILSASESLGDDWAFLPRWIRVGVERAVVMAECSGTVFLDVTPLSEEALFELRELGRRLRAIGLLEGGQRVSSAVSEQTMAKLAQTLHLERVVVGDWFAESADSRCIADFAKQLTSGDWTESERIALMALVLASVDRYMEKVEAPPREWPLIVGLLEGDASLYRRSVDCWLEGYEDGRANGALAARLRALNLGR